MRVLAPLLVLNLAACGASPAAEVGAMLAADLSVILLRSLPSLAEGLSSDSGQREAEWEDEEAPGADAAAVSASAPAREEPALALSIGSRRAVARLIQAQGERRLWRTPGGVVVATEGARIVATAGLREALAATRFDGRDPLESVATLQLREARSRRIVDLMPANRRPAGMRFGLALDCRLRPVSTQGAEALELEERCRGDARFTNRFWADPSSGAVFRSEQWVGERLPPLVVEVVSAPAS